MVILNSVKSLIVKPTHYQCQKHRSLFLRIIIKMKHKQPLNKQLHIVQERNHSSQIIIFFQHWKMLHEFMQGNQTIMVKSLQTHRVPIRAKGRTIGARTSWLKVYWQEKKIQKWNLQCVIHEEQMNVTYTYKIIYMKVGFTADKLTIRTDARIKEGDSSLHFIIDFEEQ